jgi:hypothetical protein
VLLQHCERIGPRISGPKIMNSSFRVLFPRIRAFALPYMGITIMFVWICRLFCRSKILRVQSLSLFGVVQLLLVDIDVVAPPSSSATSSSPAICHAAVHPWQQQPVMLATMQPCESVVLRLSSYPSSLLLYHFNQLTGHVIFSTVQKIGKIEKKLMAYISGSRCDA